MMGARWRAVVLAVALSGAASLVRAQQPPVQAGPQASVPLPLPPTPLIQPAPAAAEVLVPAGTLVDIEITEPISTLTIKRGDMFGIRLASPVMLDGKVVLPAGLTGEGQVIEATPSGAFGKPAKLLLAARYLEAEGGRLPLRAMKFGASGKDEANAVLVANMVPYVGILADFAHGGEIEIPAGTHAVAKLGADVPAPMTTPAPAPTAQSNSTQQGKTP